MPVTPGNSPTPASDSSQPAKTTTEKQHRQFRASKIWNEIRRMDEEESYCFLELFDKCCQGHTFYLYVFGIGYCVDAVFHLFFWKPEIDKPEKPKSKKGGGNAKQGKAAKSAEKFGEADDTAGETADDSGFLELGSTEFGRMRSSPSYNFAGPITSPAGYYIRSAGGPDVTGKFSRFYSTQAPQHVMSPTTNNAFVLVNNHDHIANRKYETGFDDHEAPDKFFLNSARNNNNNYSIHQRRRRDRKGGQQGGTYYTMKKHNRRHQDTRQDTRNTPVNFLSTKTKQFASDIDNAIVSVEKTVKGVGTDIDEGVNDVSKVVDKGLMNTGDFQGSGPSGSHYKTLTAAQREETFKPMTKDDEYQQAVRLYEVKTMWVKRDKGRVTVYKWLPRFKSLNEFVCWKTNGCNKCGCKDSCEEEGEEEEEDEEEGGGKDGGKQGKQKANDGTTNNDSQNAADDNADDADADDADDDDDADDGRACWGALQKTPCYRCIASDCGAVQNWLNAWSVVGADANALIEGCFTVVGSYALVDMTADGFGIPSGLQQSKTIKKSETFQLLLIYSAAYMGSGNSYINALIPCAFWYIWKFYWSTEEGEASW